MGLGRPRAPSGPCRCLGEKEPLRSLAKVAALPQRQSTVRGRQMWRLFKIDGPVELKPHGRVSSLKLSSPGSSTKRVASCHRSTRRPRCTATKCRMASQSSAGVLLHASLSSKAHHTLGGPATPDRPWENALLGHQGVPCTVRELTGRLQVRIG